MPSRRTWTYCLRIQGLSPETMAMARLAEYLARFADLLGDAARPTFAGVVKGSVELRAMDHSDHTALLATRLRLAANDDGAAHTAYERVSAMLQSDGARGQVLDRQRAVVVQFPLQQSALVAEPEHLISDSADLDGVVVAIEGVDDTTHLGLQDPATRVVTRIKVRSLALAQQAAQHFRGAVVRVKVHGKWRRDASGQWQAHALYADALEELDQRSAVDVFKELRAVPGNGWAALSRAEADALLADMRGGD